MKRLSVGDKVTFGRYEQDVEDVKMPIVWRVLGQNRESSQTLLLSEKGLIARPYYLENIPITWEHSCLRKWLNRTFLNTAFTSEEQSMITTTDVPADKNPDYDINPGNPTEDKIFVLSYSEAERYFRNDDDRICRPTLYAVKSGVEVDPDNGGCVWWLRTPGPDEDIAETIGSLGRLYTIGGSRVCTDMIAARPALWLKF